MSEVLGKLPATLVHENGADGSRGSKSVIFSRTISEFDLQVPVVRVVAREFQASAQAAISEALSVSILRGANPVRGWLVGATDGEAWGWWGPISEQIAEYAVNIFYAIGPREPSTPDGWAELARQYTRHAHSGLGSVAVGAFELAVWDLAGQRADRPVWALFRDEPAVNSIEGYATCFGFDAREVEGRKLASEIEALGWRLQKWRPSDCGGEIINELSGSLGADSQIALDFGGLWPKEKVVDFLEHISCELAWIEEPVPPWRLSELKELSLPAPVAAGEHCYGVHETVLLETAGVSIWQPDAVFCGGFSNLLRIADRALSFGARCIPHGGGLLPAVHAAACGARVESVEWHLVVEPKRQAHLAEPVAPGERPSIAIPYRPGWAGRLNLDLIR